MRSNAEADRNALKERHGAGKSSGQPAEESRSEMLLAVAVILAILWVILFFAVHITSFAIHIVIILAIISLIAHLFTGRKAA
jgi:multidrug efflux pump subunit AcrB